MPTSCAKHRLRLMITYPHAKSKRGARQRNNKACSSLKSKVYTLLKDTLKLTKRFKTKREGLSTPPHSNIYKYPSQQHSCVLGGMRLCVYKCNTRSFISCVRP